jgi:hypothetical protein
MDSAQSKLISMKSPGDIEARTAVILAVYFCITGQLVVGNTTISRISWHQQVEERADLNPQMMQYENPTPQCSVSGPAAPMGSGR